MFRLKMSIILKGKFNVSTLSRNFFRRLFRYLSGLNFHA